MSIGVMSFSVIVFNLAPWQIRHIRLDGGCRGGANLIARQRLPAAGGCRARGGIELALVMGTMAHRQNNTSHWALFFVSGAFAVTGFLMVTAGPNLPAGSADQWRRTAAGWERATAWANASGLRAAIAPLPARSVTASAPPRYDTHPAVLALLQVVGTLTALGMFVAPAPQSFRGWISMLTQSFRASAFGS